MRIIGISGEAHSGKDTTYLLLEDLLVADGYKVKKLSFAGKLKDSLCLLLGWSRELLEYDTPYKEGGLGDDPACQMLGMSRREIMQKAGTEGMRQGVHQDFWVICMKLAIQRGEFANIDFGFLTDCRFINELQFVRDLDGYLIKVQAPETVTTSHAAHASETEWKGWTDWDSVILNNRLPTLTNEENLLRYRRSLSTLVASKLIWDDQSERRFTHDVSARR